ncbi:MAG: Flp pilus assembly protein CpaB [Chloroflexota bacterium]|nr:Flp pilus assembly protein CpaB [Chloroflexota bacterium]
MKRSNRLVIFVGVLLAILAFVGIVILLNQTPTGTGTGQLTTVKVLVAKVAIAIGDPVTPDKVEARDVQPGAVNGTPFSDPSQVGGQPALVNIPAGGQVNHESLPGGAGPISARLKPGEKAIAFQVERVTGLDFLIQSGDVVDIVMSQKLTVLQPTADTASKPASQRRFETLPGLDGAETVKTILQGKRVLYVSQSRTVQAQQPAASASPSAGGATAATPATIENVIIVIAGTDQDAEVIKFAQNDLSVLGPLTAVLRSAQDTAVEKTTGITIDALVSQYGLRIPNIIQQLSPGK